MGSLTRVLIVDDDADYIDVLAFELRPFADKYEVDSVATFDDGLQAIQRGEHDIYLVDYQLDHGHTGDLLVDQATANLRPVVMLTGLEDDDLGDRIIGAGACDFVMKRHATGPLLDRVIRNALGRRHRLRRIVERQRELAVLVSRDPLTGLLNRSFLKEQIDKQLSSVKHEGALLYLDLDGFKSVNDTYGHGVGDAVLQGVAGRLIECVQAQDIVGRVGGDEFIIYLQLDTNPQVTLEATRSVAGRLCAAIARPYTIPSENGGVIAVSVSLSVGIAVTSTTGHDYKELMGTADRAMYRAKKNGKNGFACDPALLARHNS